MSDYDGLLGKVFGGGLTNPSVSKPEAEKGAKIRGRKLDGNQYVRAADIAAYLELNGRTPAGLYRAMLRAAGGDDPS